MKNPLKSFNLKWQWFDIMKIFKILFILFLFCISNIAFAEEGSYTLKAGVSMIDQVPNAFYGNWRVSSRLQRTNAPAKFNSTSIDLWNLSRNGDVINLSNPFTGANATLSLSEVSENCIKFTRTTGEEGNQRMTEAIELKLGKEAFTGTNTLYLQIISGVNGQVVSTYTAQYTLRGEKLSGMSIF